MCYLFNAILQMKNCVVLISETFFYFLFNKIIIIISGHVLGAAMFQVRVGSESLVYTGDYNMTPDRHLGAAWIGTVHILRKHL